MTPDLRLWTKTSARVTSLLRISRPPSLLRSSARLFLFRFNAMKTALSRPQKGGPHARASSPRPGRSTLTTSAPMSPSVWVQNGPATFWVRSTTTIPSSGRATDASVAAPVAAGESPSRSAAVPCLEQQRSARAGVRAVAHAGRTARVHARAERAAEPQVLEAALDDQDLLPEVVRDGLGGTDAGREAEQAREVAGGRIAAFAISAARRGAPRSAHARRATPTRAAPPRGRRAGPGGRAGTPSAGPTRHTCGPSCRRSRRAARGPCSRARRPPCARRRRRARRWRTSLRPRVFERLQDFLRLEQLERVLLNLHVAKDTLAIDDEVRTLGVAEDRARGVGDDRVVRAGSCHGVSLHRVPASHTAQTPRWDPRFPRHFLSVSSARTRAAPAASPVSFWLHM